MKTLYITNTYLAGRSGVVNASKAFVNAFAALSNVVTVVYPQDGNYQVEDVKGDNVEFIPIEDKRSKITKFIGILIGKTHRYSKETTALFDKTQYDVVVFDSSIVSFRLIKKAKNAGLKTITIHHNYQIEYTKDDERSILKFPLLFWTYRFEKEAVCYSDLNLTFTKSDEYSLREHYKKTAEIDVVSLFEHTKTDLIACKNAKNKRMSFVITGQLYSLQTVNSLLPWLKNYFPLLKKTYPEAELIVAGRRPSQKLINACEENGVVIIPSPEDIDAIVRGSDYYICPTALGSGMKLRIMDGLKNGLCVLTHERSARGYEEMIRRGVVYEYHDTNSFLTSLKAMVNSKKDHRTIIETYYGWFSLESGINRLKAILNRHQILK